MFLDPPYCRNDVRYIKYQDKEDHYGSYKQEWAQVVASLVTSPIHRCAIGEEETGESVHITDTIIGTSLL